MTRFDARLDMLDRSPHRILPQPLPLRGRASPGASEIRSAPLESAAPRNGGPAPIYLHEASETASARAQRLRTRGDAAGAAAPRRLRRSRGGAGGVQAPLGFGVGVGGKRTQAQHLDVVSEVVRIDGAHDV